MHPTPYRELNQVLAKLVSQQQTLLPDMFLGAYLQGSFAVGDFDRYSDVDFIIVLHDDLTSDQIDALQVMHGQIYELDSAWAQHLEGSYFPKGVLRDPLRRGQELWYLDHGARSLVRSDHCNTLLVRWIVRERGIILAGPSPKNLLDPVSTEELKAEIFETLTTWGRQIMADPEPYNNRFYQSFIVLNYCRMLHDLRRGRPGTKREGAEWAKTNLDPSWRALIDRAWDGRPYPARKVKEPADPEEFEMTLRFVEVVMQESRRFFRAQTDAS